MCAKGILLFVKATLNIVNNGAFYIFAIFFFAYYMYGLSMHFDIREFDDFGGNIFGVSLYYGLRYSLVGIMG
jgi:hypothetical protein